jgi:hypothetical protein
MSAVYSNLEPIVPVALPKERPVWMERQWVALDSLGAVRNTLYTTSVFLEKTAKATSAILNIIPGFQLFGGALLSYNAARYTIPNSIKEFKAVAPGDREGKVVAGLSVANQLLYGSIGPAFLVAGATGVASIATSGAVSSGLATAADIVASGVLGGLCVARGLVMMARSSINLSYLLPFHENFRKAVDAGTAIEFLGKERGNLDALKRRIGDSAAEKVVEFFNNPDPTKVDELLQIVDKGIFKQKCKQWLTLSIAFLMFVGGIASIVFSAGLTAVAVAAVMGITFALMEGEWLLFDKANWFNAIVDKLYTPLPSKPKEIQEQAAPPEPMSA